MSNDSIEMTEPDIYGQRHPVETPILLENKLKEFEIEITKLPHQRTVSVRRAQEKCPQLLDDDFKLMFLRCEVFNAELAAVRYAKYWDKRRELFGNVKAFMPLTQAKACQEDKVAMEFGFIRIIPRVKDPTGRTILFLDPSRQDKTQYTRESMTRSLWYTIHAALQGPNAAGGDGNNPSDDDDHPHVTAQQKGVVFVGYPRNTKFSQIDRKQMKMNVESLRGCLPVRLSAIHLCHPPTFFQVVFPLLSLLMGERLRKRIKVHAGSKEHVLKQLEFPYGLTKNHLPSDLGGTIELDHLTWLKERALQGN